jgi:leucyl aminopeptidase
LLQIKSFDFKKDRLDALMIIACEDKEIYADKAIQSLIRKARSLDEFKGMEKDEITFYSPPEIKAGRVTVMGIGKLGKVDAESLRAASGKAVRDAMKKGVEVLSIAVPSSGELGMEMPNLLEALGEGAVLANHLFSKYRKEEKIKPLGKITLLTDRSSAEDASRLCGRIETVCGAAHLARDWVNTPSNDKTPELFAASIAQAAEKHHLKATVFDEKALKQKKFGALLAVAGGSRSKPRLVIVEQHAKDAEKTVALVGKGVTFDSGGINLKPGGSLDGMKADMSGAAIVAATLVAAARLKPKLNLIGLMPIVENMPSGSAVRPGDIVRSFSGKSIEIGNTDAEGRLILADTLAYAVKTYKPHTLIDLATLTGACVIALGEKIAGVFSMDDRLAELILGSGEKTGERCWQMPMPQDYKEHLKSDFADLKNVGDSRWGGAIVAALFLNEFIDRTRCDTRWAHIDIAGPSYLKKESAYCGAGATGFGVRLLCDLLEKL